MSKMAKTRQRAPNRVYQCPGCWGVLIAPRPFDGWMECSCGQKMTLIDLREQESDQRRPVQATWRGGGGMSQSDSEPMGVEAMTQVLRGDPLHRLLDLYGPVEIHISLKQDTPEAGSGWTGEVRWQGDEWARIHASTRGRALDLIAGYVRAA